MKNSSGRGFTLLELVIVLVIISITLGYIGPSLFGGLFSSNMDRVTRDMGTMIQLARSWAITQHKTYLVHFDIDQSSIGIYLKPESSGVIPEMLKERTLPEGVIIKKIKTPYQIPKQEGELDLRITPEGLVEQGIIYLEAGYGKTYTLVIKPFSGNFRVYDHFVEISYG
ncbi:MAG: type II secretion system protein [Deltaproteobacteria bacterium]|nr:type II secretion system protein [Deltaproteobacteria bacterium]